MNAEFTLDFVCRNSINGFRGDYWNMLTRNSTLKTKKVQNNRTIITYFWHYNDTQGVAREF